MFPSGEVAHRRAVSGGLVESPWRSTVGRLALTTGAQVLPAFIEGTNSRLFYVAGCVHPALRTMLLARELLNKRGHTVTVRLGTALAARSLAASPSDATEATASIRQAVEGLGQESEAVVPISPKRRVERGSTTSAIASELAQLPDDCCLVQSGECQVFLANASQVPHAMREIGRLREVTFRAVGEGTGRDLDLDAFDDRYLHLFSWDCRQQQIVGAYRIGRTDVIMAARGVSGLYTRTLFRYDRRLIDRLSPALELGRSFVRAEYQKSYHALLPLWRGIGQFVARHPEYRVLFGPVSISSRYSDHSHRLLMAFLQQHHLERDLADLVQGITAHQVNPAPTALIPQSIDEANRLVAEAEADGKGLPILLRQYLKLNAKLLGFNVDPQFGGALDALMMVDLTTVDAGLLNRYLGRREAAHFLTHHLATQSAHAA